MKKTANIILCMVLVLCLASLIDAQKIETIDGVEVIYNDSKPKPPKGTPSKLVLEELMTIGDTEDPELSFSGMDLPFVVDDSGMIYALDMQSGCIKIFDGSGQLVSTFGKKGQGPGEFNMPSGIQITPENTLMIEDVTNRRLSYYSFQGEHIKDVSTATKLAMVRVLISKQGNMFGMQMGMPANMNEGKMYYEFNMLDKELNSLFTLAKIEFSIPIPGSGNKMNIMDMTAPYQFDSKGNILFARNQDYEIKVFNPEGKNIRTIKKDYKPLKITQEDIDEMLERIPSNAGGINTREMFEFPDYFPPFQNFVLDEQDRIYARTYVKGKNKEEYVVDIFDSKGIFISQLVTKADFRIWKKNKVYSVEENEDGYRILKIYQATWEK
ncbi:MAG: 6-bladed beta-propeller [Candidatus Aminicenantes bacterium]|nr:6-bladed beta-propeller [Candidatus Aminicenantes bacterium]